MLLSAVIPLVGANPVLLALIGLSGMVAVTSSESTGLQSVDQAALPQTVSAQQRTSAFALYNLVAAAASAVGALSVGPMVSLGHAIGLEGLRLRTRLHRLCAGRAGQHHPDPGPGRARRIR